MLSITEYAFSNTMQDGASGASMERERAWKAGSYRLEHGRQIENGKHKSNETTMRAIRQAFEAAGLVFIDADETAGAGVREKRAAE
jgi:hypothetical protein